MLDHCPETVTTAVLGNVHVDILGARPRLSTISGAQHAGGGSRRIGPMDLGAMTRSR